MRLNSQWNAYDKKCISNFCLNIWSFRTRFLNSENATFFQSGTYNYIRARRCRNKRLLLFTRLRAVRRVQNFGSEFSRQARNKILKRDSNRPEDVVIRSLTLPWCTLVDLFPKEVYNKVYITVRWSQCCITTWYAAHRPPWGLSTLLGRCLLAVVEAAIFEDIEDPRELYSQRLARKPIVRPIS